MAYRRPYKENIKLQFITKLIVEIILVVSITYLLVLYTCGQYKVSGNSMNDIFNDGQTVLINRLIYVFEEPARYDIIYFRPQGISSSRTYIKRIIGLPGETIQIIQGKVYVNGSVLTDDINSEVILSAGLASSPITLSENEYFVLGDNRNNSEDSRFSAIGNVKRENIIGSPWLIISPLNEMNLIFRGYRTPQKDDGNKEE